MRLQQKTFESLLMLAAFAGYAFLAYVLYLLFVPTAAPQWAQAANRSLESMLHPYEPQIKGFFVVGLALWLLYDFQKLQENVAAIRRELTELNEKLRHRSE